MNKAIFLDRDGVINKMIYNPSTKEFEPPHSPEKFEFYDGVISSLDLFQHAGYKLFLISNQPDYAKGKTSLENIMEVHDSFDKILKENKIIFSDYFYCYHHPEGTLKEVSYVCECRKPSPYFILNAIRKYNLDPGNSWMIGDRNTDVLCGKNAGIKTVLINNGNFTPEDIKGINPVICESTLESAARKINEENLVKIKEIS